MKFNSVPFIPFLGFFIMSVLNNNTQAEDWGAYSIVPVSAQAFVLEAVESGVKEGTVVSIGKPAGTDNQKWVITPKGDNFFSISPLHSPGMVLAAEKGGTKLGTPIVLEKDNGQAWARWQMKKNENGFYRLIPGHTEEMDLDHLGGDQRAGAKIDLWKSVPEDQHLHWIIKPLAGTLPAVGNIETASTYFPPELKPEDIPVGEIKHCTFSESSVFPGTVRDVTVFIPAQYDGSKPACVYVKTDGFNPGEKPYLELLIAAKEMPVSIGVFVRPGDLPAPMKNTMGRRNRCFEYDAVGDDNVRFLIDELLPFVAKKFDLKLSTSGNDRCIAGGSSGGIAAFNAAWQRPDAFTRVYANSGSFVAFRGGHEYPTLIRKFEAKPIRSYLTTGTRDMENCAGDWYLLDQEMDKALKFSGYDYRFKTINGGHVAGYNENFMEAMSFIWKDWPQPVKAGPSAPRIRDVIVPNETWQLISKDHSRDHHGAFAAACNSKGDVFFNANEKLFRIDNEGHVDEFLSGVGIATGLSFGADGQLYAATNSEKIMAYDANGHGRVVFDLGTDVGRLRQILAMPDGGIYFTSFPNQSRTGGVISYLKNGNRLNLEGGPKSPTGLAYRPDQWLLSVADGNSKWVHSYQVNADGKLTNHERFFWLHVPDWEDNSGAESICYAKEGQMFVATNWGIQVCADDGPTQVILPMPDRQRVLGVCFGGSQFDTLFAFCGTTIWKRKVKVHGIGAFSPWVPVHGTPL